MTTIPQNAFFVSTAWLAEHLGAPDVAVIDGTFFLPDEKRDAEAEYREVLKKDPQLAGIHYRIARLLLSGPPAAIVSEQGYYSPTTNIKSLMPPDKYAFWYEGKPWKGAPERGIKEGDLRDGGSLEQRASTVAYWHQWPDEYDYLMKKWDEFLSA